MKLNIDFDEFKEYIQNRKNAETLLEKKRKWPLDYLVLDGELVFEKNKITASFINKRNSSQRGLNVTFKKSKFNNIVLIANSRSTYFFAPISIFIILFFIFIPPTPMEPLVYVIITGACPFLWLMYYLGTKIGVRSLCKIINKNWKILSSP